MTDIPFTADYFHDNKGGHVLWLLNVMVCDRHQLRTEALNLIREIKTSHTAKQSSTNNLRGSTAEDLLEFAGTWSGDDIRQCLQLVHDTRMPLEF